ncbi:Transcriptional repressor NrdR protein [Candidatus Micropelagos thuwalensis]|uniref:Transcriptional repressor NrdR protein n=1 Tax=Candidatus Micropelagius thuwalensis TaxID=1397666 RepID=U2WTQ4_9PROT|nr:surface-adhesin E family protein [Candidatus Micropelagos thuwalensis]ERL46930.1 Transcriptional repressor NrdR protein [Candidatus Micropelagos thuwalensis]
MKPLFLTIALLFSTPAWAEWELFASGPIAEVYMDLNSIRIKDGYVFHWELINWKKPTERFHSLKMYRQSDCDLRRQKTLQIVTYLQPMGVGKVIDSESVAPDEEKWEYPPPDDNSALALGYICNALENAKKNNPPSRN